MRRLQRHWQTLLNLVIIGLASNVVLAWLSHIILSPHANGLSIFDNLWNQQNRYIFQMWHCKLLKEVKMHYSVNMLIQWQNDRGEWEDQAGETYIERVLWINDLATHVATIDINPANTVAWPRIRRRTELDQGFEEGKARFTMQDPYFRLYRLDKDIKEEHRKRRDSAMDSIRPIVENHGLDLLDSKVLGPLISNAANTSGKDMKIFYIRLRRYWQGGQTENALLPLWHRCGGKGKERVINDNADTPDDGEKSPNDAVEHVKRGRPTGWSKRHGGEPDGINI